MRDAPGGTGGSGSMELGGSPPGEGMGHVCFLTSSAPLGPGNSYSPFILDLAQGLQAKGWRITVLTPHVRGSAEEETIRSVAVRRYRYLPSRRAETLGLGGGMLPGLRARRPDALKVPFLVLGQRRALGQLHRHDPLTLLHTHWLLPQGLVGARFTRSRSLPHVATAHGSDVLGISFPGMRSALRYVARRCDALTVNSRAVADALLAATGGGDVRIVPMGARRPEPGSAAGVLELRRSLPAARHVLGFVGRVVEEKGALDFLRVLSILREDGLDVVGLVVGGGAAEDDARRLAHELGISDRVRFTGSVPPEDVPRHMSVLDTLIVPSHHEAQGLVAVEAMLLGVPVAAFSTGGLRDVVVEGRTGLAAPPRDVPALAGAVERILHDPSLVRRLTTRARAVALERFTLEACAARFDGLYREILGARSSSARGRPGIASDDDRAIRAR